MQINYTSTLFWEMDRQYEHYDDEQEYETFLFHNNNFNPAITV